MSQEQHFLFPELKKFEDATPSEAKLLLLLVAARGHRHRHHRHGCLGRGAAHRDRDDRGVGGHQGEFEGPEDAAM